MFRSSEEVKYVSLATLTEMVWVTSLFKKLKVDLHVPTTIRCDTKTTIEIAANSIFHERTKYVEINCYFINTILMWKVSRFKTRCDVTFFIHPDKSM